MGQIGKTSFFIPPHASILITGAAETVSGAFIFDQIKQDDDGSHKTINPNGIIPAYPSWIGWHK